MPSRDLTRVMHVHSMRITCARSYHAGGLLFWSAPFLERYHHSFEAKDYFRYTCLGASELFIQAGFEIVDAKKIGDAHMASAALLGFGAGDLSPEHIAHALVSNYSLSLDDRRAQRWLSISCVLIARRPHVESDIS